MPFEDWPLHDAVLKELRVDWENRTCTVHVLAFVEPRHDAAPCQLIWRGLRRLIVPAEYPWGRSIFINRQWIERNGCYSIEVQSGDVLAIEADSPEFIR